MEKDLWQQIQSDVEWAEIEVINDECVRKLYMI